MENEQRVNKLQATEQEVKESRMKQSISKLRQHLNWKKL